MNEQDEEVAHPGNGISTSRTTTFRPIWQFATDSIDFISHQEALDTLTPMGRAMFTIIAAMAELERSVICERVMAGLQYARQHGTKSGKPIGRPRAVFRRDKIEELRGRGLGWRQIGRELGVSATTIRRAYRTPPFAIGVSKTRMAGYVPRFLVNSVQLLSGSRIASDEQ